MRLQMADGLQHDRLEAAIAEGITTEDMAAFAVGEATDLVEVSFVEWTRDGFLHQSEFIGVRHDKPSLEIRQVL